MANITTISQQSLAYNVPRAFHGLSHLILTTSRYFKKKWVSTFFIICVPLIRNGSLENLKQLAQGSYSLPSKANEINSDPGILSPEPTSLIKTSYYSHKWKTFPGPKNNPNQGPRSNSEQTFRQQKAQKLRAGAEPGVMPEVQQFLPLLDSSRVLAQPGWGSPGQNMIMYVLELPRASLGEMMTCRD